MADQAASDVLITGAAGEIGRVLRSGLAGRYNRLVLLDRAPMDPAGPGEELHVADMADRAALRAAMQGIDCVVHFAGVPREAEWEPILEANIAGCYNVFEAAREAGVRRMVYASSNHTVGYHRAERVLDETAEIRPDSRYGVSKVFGEALGRLYADKYGLSVICLRIGSFRARPMAQRELATWISHSDMVHLAACSIDAPPGLHFEVFYGVSNNLGRRWTDRAEELIGFEPKDRAEDAVLPASLPREDEGPATMFHGGPVCAREFAGDPASID
jgi:uronate dehydrogenase